MMFIFAVVVVGLFAFLMVCIAALLYIKASAAIKRGWNPFR